MQNTTTMNYKTSMSDLPPELLTLISQRLRTQVCVLRFRSVCRTWRDSCILPLSSCNNKNILCPLFPYEAEYEGSHDYFVLNTILLIEPKNNNTNLSSEHKSWMIFVDEFLPGRLSLRYPLSNNRVFDPYYPKHLPNKFINLLDFRVTEVARSCSYSSCSCSNRSSWNKEVDKVVLFPGHDMPFCRDDFDFKAAIVRNNGDFVVYDSSVEGHKCRNMHMKVDDVVNYKGRIFAFGRNRMTYVVDYDALKVVKVAEFVSVPDVKRKRLVVSDNGLYIVAMDHSKCYTPKRNCKNNSSDDDDIRFRAFKLNEEAGRWVEVSRLDDQVFFVGSDCSFSFSTQNNHGFERNCIYAFRNSFLREREARYSLRGPRASTIGVFKLKGRGGSFRPLDTCEVFWPAPLWIEQSSRASEISRMNQGTTLEEDREIDDDSVASASDECC